MRRLLDILIVVLVLATAVAWFTHRDDQEQQVATEQSARASLARLYERSAYHGALQDSVHATGTVFPVDIRPEWFAGRLPVNTALPDTHPWLDVAPPGDESAHPPDPVALHEHQAGIWYNPNLGVFRARVPGHLSDLDALSLYNQVNGTSLDALTRDTAAARQPLAYTPGQGDAAALASPNYRVASVPTDRPADAPPPDDKAAFSFNPGVIGLTSTPLDSDDPHADSPFVPQAQVEDPPAPEPQKPRRRSLTTRSAAAE